MIAVSFALPAESSEFIRRRPDVPILHTGVGQDAVARTLDCFLERHRPQVLISSGFAGGLTGNLRIGQIFLAQNLSDPELLSSAQGALASMSPRVGTLITGSAVIDSREERDALARSSGAVAIDMESEFIGAACARHGVRMLSLRAFSDTPQRPFGIPSAVLFDLQRQRTNLGRLAAYLVRHPGAVSRLVGIGARVKTARRALAAALELVVRTAI